MKILRFEVVDLLNRKGTLSATLNPDVNILTGRNGAGKTSLLKLLWYLTSGNIFLALQEVAFSRVTIETDEYSCTVHRLSNLDCKVELKIGDEEYLLEDSHDEEQEHFQTAEDQANEFLVGVGSSLFFPTFRRIEGGFGLARQRLGSRMLPPRPTRSQSDIEDNLQALSKRLSHGAHVFISSISTADIVSLLLSQFTELSERYASLLQQTSSEVINSIKEFRSDVESAQQVDAAKRLLDEVRSKIEKTEALREEIMAPMDAVQHLVEKLFQHKGISISNRLSFGDAAAAVNSDVLSAGEKQMLSFISYNAFNKESIVIIDEPELSLHVDWQRQLFPTLLSQQSSNQFIAATHSPFIYTKYPDKEIQIDLDRGD